MNGTDVVKEFKEGIKLEGGFTAKDPKVPLVIVAGGRNVWQEYKELTQKLPKFNTMGINAAGAYAPTCDYWFSLHADYLVVWALCRKQMYKGKEKYKNPTLISLRKTGQLTDYDIFAKIDNTVCVGDPTIKRSAKHSGQLEDSGFIGMCAALAAGYEKIYLCGMPADDSGHVFIPDWQYLEHDREAIRKAWIDAIEAYPIIKERVRSMSGLTKELLGSDFNQINPEQVMYSITGGI